MTFIKNSIITKQNAIYPSLLHVNGKKGGGGRRNKNQPVIHLLNVDLENNQHSLDGTFAQSHYLGNYSTRTL